MPALRLVFFGTPEIAVPTLERLVAGPHDVVGVVSQPDRARGRGRQRSPSPVSAVALDHEIPLLRPERVGDADDVEALRALRPDLGVVVAFGQFLPKPVRELPSRGYLINAHASLLPKYRGASPIAQAILDREPETGISVMRVEREMDAGPVANVARTPIAPGENTAELTARLAALAADAIAEAVDAIAEDRVAWTPQDESQATLAPKLEKADAELDLRESADALAARVHAVSPRPAASLRLEAGPAEGEPTTLKVSRAEALPFEARDGSDSEVADVPRPAPGTIEQDAGGARLRIATGDGWLVPLVLQRPGGRAMAVDDFLRGFELPAKARFTLPEHKAQGADDAEDAEDAGEEPA